MQSQTALESEIAKLMVSALNHSDIDPAQINPEDILADGDLALHSIDMLELSEALSKKYSITIDSEYNQWHEGFASLRALAALVETLKVG